MLVRDLAHGVEHVASQPRQSAEPTEPSILASALVTLVPLIVIFAIGAWLVLVIRRQQGHTSTALALAERELAVHQQSLEELRAIRKLLESSRP